VALEYVRKNYATFDENAVSSGVGKKGGKSKESWN
jgi:hypothetical protein